MQSGNNAVGIRKPQPVQMFHVWVIFSGDTQQHYYTASLKDTPPAERRNLRIHYTVKARSEHDAIARIMLGAYSTKEAPR